MQIRDGDRAGAQTEPMNETTTTALLALAILALAWLAISHLRYRLTHRYDEADLAAARKDATKRSRSVLAGKAGEQMAPLVPAFSDRFDPAEARFLGAPIDYVVFDGLGRGELREVVLVEVKTGASRLSASEREVERAIAEGRVRFETLRL